MLNNRGVRMSVETETVEAVSQVQIQPSFTKKTSTETIRSKKHFKRPKVNLLTDRSKSAVFAAKVASAVEECADDEETESFVYDNNVMPNIEAAKLSPTNSTSSAASSLRFAMNRPQHSTYGATDVTGNRSLANGYRAFMFSSIPLNTDLTNVRTNWAATVPAASHAANSNMFSPYTHNAYHRPAYAFGHVRRTSRTIPMMLRHSFKWRIALVLVVFVFFGLLIFLLFHWLPPLLWKLRSIGSGRRPHMYARDA
ncbi:Vac7 [Schizosaccharomyces japonicus yFS275]|uniref:Vac7 n=1 Tax=Schizosaccharomyces japonicus (strain yFS275 / FY16936) TaxID=402676 RepID=B6K0V0_SCHJY|nr:Vac7 [Schizosaccharomyces japonicus yFS275]EEB07571.1 Vac7 [Schizosaccharomyces japonicus yFS275]